MQSYHYLIQVSINIFYSGGLTFRQKDQKDEVVSGKFVASGIDPIKSFPFPISFPASTNLPETVSSFWSFCPKVIPPL